MSRNLAFINLTAASTPGWKKMKIVELTRAQIRMFERDPHSDGSIIVGILYFPHPDKAVHADTEAVQATLTRENDCWKVELSKPLPQAVAVTLLEKRDDVRIEDDDDDEETEGEDESEECDSKEPLFEEITVYFADGPEGLAAIRQALVDSFGQPDDAWPGPEGFSPVAWSATPEELATLEIDALVHFDAPDDNLCHYLQMALQIAQQTFGKDSAPVQRLYALIFPLIPTRVIRLYGRGLDSLDLSYRCAWIAKIEDALSLHIAAAQSVGAFRVAASVTQDLARERTRLISLWQALLVNLAKTAKEYESGTDDDFSIARGRDLRFDEALGYYNLGLLQRRCGYVDQSRQLISQAIKLAMRLTPQYKIGFARETGIPMPDEEPTETIKVPGENQDAGV